MKIVLNKVTIANFKGIKSFEAEFGEETTITGANGTGKTSVYDAFLWLLFGKDSTGRKDFGLRPTDEAGDVIKGLVSAVEAEISIDEKNHTLRKEHHEKVIKRQLRGYETLCWIDEVPKKVGEYNEWLSDIVQEDTFRLLTDLKQFAAGLHWKDRRDVLLELAGDTASPDMPTELLDGMDGRSIDEYKKVLAERKKLYVKERDEINPRIDEIQKGSKDFVGETGKLFARREKVELEVEKLETQRKRVLGQEQSRQREIEAVNKLKANKAARETEMRNDNSGVQKLIDKKTEISAEVAEIGMKATTLENDIKFTLEKLDANNKRSDTLTKSLVEIREKYTKANTTNDAVMCYACGQKLPADKIKAMVTKRKTELAEIVKGGNATKKEVSRLEADGESLNEKLAELEAKHKEIIFDLTTAETGKDKLFRQLDNDIANRPEPVFAEDITWLKICKDIDIAESEIGQPVAEQLQKIEVAHKGISGELNDLNSTLARSDRLDEDKKRISELESKETELAQKIADIEGMLQLIDEYRKEESAIIEEAVNGRFKHVNFRLFDYKLNGSIDDCCEVMLNGVPYGDISYGQKIFVGIDIINVLSQHYGVKCPLWIDNIEGLTLPVETEAQVIGLKAVEGKELSVN